MVGFFEAVGVYGLGLLGRPTWSRVGHVARRTDPTLPIMPWHFPYTCSVISLLYNEIYLLLPI